CNLAANCIGGMYLAAMMIDLGVSDALISVIVSFSTFAGLAMGFSPYIAAKLKRVKLFILLGCGIQLIPWSLLFFLPILGATASSAALIGSVYLICCIVGNIITPSYSELREAVAQDSGHPERFYGLKEAIGNICIVIAFLITTIIYKQWDGERAYIAYTIAGCVGVAAGIARLIFLMGVTVPKMEPVKHPGSFFRIIRDMFTCKQFRPYLIYGVFITIGGAFVSGIDTIFFVDKMGLSVSFISLMLMLGVIGRAFFAPVWGRVAEKIGISRSLSIAVFITAFCYLVNFFTNPGNAVVFRVIANAIALFGCSGTGVLATPFIYRCTPVEYHYQFVSFINVVAMAISYPLTLLVSLCVKLWGGWTATFLGNEISLMHILYLFTTACYIGVSVYLLNIKDRKLA
ncbi:MAG: MFS transporter, partial [Clostridia bacterium]|nr:MFS transporter [Clostridia bacterium]